MFESFTNFMLKEHLAGQTFDPPTGPICYSRQVDPDRQPFPTKDGYISIVPYTDDSWSKVFAVLEAPEILDQEKFSTARGRLKHLDELYRAVGRLTVQKTSEELTARFRAASIPAMPVRDVAQIRDDPHLEATGFFTRRAHPTEGMFFDMKAPVRFGAWRSPPPSPAPTIGQQSDELEHMADA
jgi:crotonobetainyl-CoA:carnitine CoA-transferase CaiB-like acyl-CoA transferase